MTFSIFEYTVGRLPACNQARGTCEASNNGARSSATAWNRVVLLIRAGHTKPAHAYLRRGLVSGNAAGRDSSDGIQVWNPVVAGCLAGGTPSTVVFLTAHLWLPVAPKCRVSSCIAGRGFLRHNHAHDIHKPRKKRVSGPYTTYYS
jgi:hypothetical protein